MAVDKNKRIKRRVRNAYIVSTVSIALVLFVFIMAINVLLNAVLKGGNKDEM